MKENLVAGAVWFNSKGKEHLVLGISNAHLSEQQQAKHPPLVVFLDPDGNLSTLSEEKFTAFLQFEKVSDNLESVFDDLLSMFVSGEYAPTEEPEDSKESTEQEKALLSIQTQAENDVEIENYGESKFSVVSDAVEKEINNELNLAFVSYEESPYGATENSLHTLTFDASAVEYATLLKVFADPTKVSKFSVNELVVEYDAYIVVSKCVFSDGGEAYKVYLVSENLPIHSYRSTELLAELIHAEIAKPVFEAKTTVTVQPKVVNLA